MNNSELEDIALFPIPGSVSFPHCIVPLHVFEPRYRTMVKYCVEHHMKVGVCHTQGVLHEIKKEQSREEALHNNQDTYKPCDIFSAGPVQVLDTFADGRMTVRVHMHQRYKRMEVKQSLPFSIYRCAAYEDLACSDPLELAQTKDKILHRLKVLTHQVPDMQRILQSREWQDCDADVFSFVLFDVLHTPPDLAQQFLEMRSSQQRLQSVLDILNRQTPGNH